MKPSFEALIATHFRDDHSLSIKMFDMRWFTGTYVLDTFYVTRMWMDREKNPVFANPGRQLGQPTHFYGDAINVNMGDRRRREKKKLISKEPLFSISSPPHNNNNEKNDSGNHSPYAYDSDDYELPCAQGTPPAKVDIESESESSSSDDSFNPSPFD